jgi:hypothetical protein
VEENANLEQCSVCRRDVSHKGDVGEPWAVADPHRTCRECGHNRLELNQTSVHVIPVGSQGTCVQRCAMEWVR